MLMITKNYSELQSMTAFQSHCLLCPLWLPCDVPRQFWEIETGSPERMRGFARAHITNKHGETAGSSKLQWELHEGKAGPYLYCLPLQPWGLGVSECCLLCEKPRGACAPVSMGRPLLPSWAAGAHWAWPVWGCWTRSPGSSGPPISKGATTSTFKGKGQFLLCLILHNKW